MNSVRASFASYWQSIQHALFPQLEHVLGPLTGKQQQLVQTLEVIRIEHLIPRYCRMPGRPPKDRAAMARAFVAKAVYDLPTTRMLLDRLDTDVVLRRVCGWERRGEVPSESVFSRAFAEFAATKIHQIDNTVPAGLEHSADLVEDVGKTVNKGRVVDNAAEITRERAVVARRAAVGSTAPPQNIPVGRRSDAQPYGVGRKVAGKHASIRGDHAVRPLGPAERRRSQASARQGDSSLRQVEADPSVPKGGSSQECRTRTAERIENRAQTRRQETTDHTGHKLFRKYSRIVDTVSTVAGKGVILDRTATTTCRGCMSGHRRQEPVWTSVRGAYVKAVSPAERGRSEATRLDVGEHTRTLFGLTMPPATTTSCGRPESSFRQFLALGNTRDSAGVFRRSAHTETEWRSQSRPEREFARRGETRREAINRKDAAEGTKNERATTGCPAGWRSPRASRSDCATTNRAHPTSSGGDRGPRAWPRRGWLRRG